MRKIWFIIVAIIISTFSLNAEVKQEGNKFVQTSNITDTATKTKYVYVDKKGNEYPIYLSATGKAYIIKVSKKTGREYRQYLPKVTAAIGTPTKKEEKK